MSRLLLLLSISFIALTPLMGQLYTPGAIDTLFYENFDADTFDIPLGVPTGDDQIWVNYDEDGTRQVCFQEEDTFGWFPYFDVNDSSNYAFTSCSFNKVGLTYCPANKPNRNWLIMPPVFISHDQTFLSWRSLIIQGPMYHDGYRVLVSTSDNFTTSFTDEIFKMAENLDINPPSSLDPSVHNFSSGYIQANSYTDQQYYTLALDGAGMLYNQGILEPHEVSLADYVGKTIYIAILHDADCDFGIQIDDLLVVDKTSSGTIDHVFADGLSVLPNPAGAEALLEIPMLTPQGATLFIYSMEGSLMTKTEVDLFGGQNTIRLHLENLPAGAYRLVVQTAKATATTMLLRK